MLISVPAISSETVQQYAWQTSMSATEASVIAEDTYILAKGPCSGDRSNRTTNNLAHTPANEDNVGEYVWSVPHNAFLLVYSWHDPFVELSYPQPDEIPYTDVFGPPVYTSGGSCVGVASQPRTLPSITVLGWPSMAQFWLSFRATYYPNIHELWVRGQVRPVNVQVPGPCRGLGDQEACDLAKEEVKPALPGRGQSFFFRFADGRSLEYKGTGALSTCVQLVGGSTGQCH
jgi:hypothetical protein